MPRIRCILTLGPLALLALLVPAGPAAAQCYQGQQCGLTDFAGNILQGFAGSAYSLTNNPATAQRLYGYSSIFNSFQPALGQLQGQFQGQQQPYQPQYQQSYGQPVTPVPVQACREGRWQFPDGRQIHGIACLTPNGEWQLQR